MKNLFDIRGRVVVVTGGAGILGRSICVYLAGQGARVAVLDRDEKAGEALVGEIRAAGGDALFFATDVLNREVLVSNREAILGAWGQIDILLNAAGGFAATVEAVEHYGDRMDVVVQTSGQRLVARCGPDSSIQ